MLKLTPTDTRAKHIIEVLESKPGDQIRVGVINGERSTATVMPEIGPRTGVNLQWGASERGSTLERIDVLLALPRPGVMERMFHILAEIGVGTLTITGAARVEKAYFASKVLKRSAVLKQLLKGLEQAGETALPRVLLSPDLRTTIRASTGVGRHPYWGPHALRLEEPEDSSAGPATIDKNGMRSDRLDGEDAPGAETETCDDDRLKLIAHPYGGRSLASTVWGAVQTARDQGKQTRVLLAIGPEGGWTDEEMSAFEEAGFTAVSLGPKTYTTTTATVAALTLTDSILRDSLAPDPVTSSHR